MSECRIMPWPGNPSASFLACEANLLLSVHVFHFRYVGALCLAVQKPVSRLPEHPP